MGSIKILLLGGTGAIGSHLANFLADQGEKVVVTSRRHREAKNSVEYRKGNARNLDFLGEILQEEKWDTIVDFMIYSEDEFRERIDLLLGSTSQYIFLSSARVYNESQKAITEESPRLLDTSPDHDYLETNEYALLKARQEDILRSLKQRNWTIIRPYITYSEKRMQLGNLEKEDWLYRALHGRTIVFSKDIKNQLTTLTYGIDVATGIANLINNPHSLGEVYHITDEHACKWDDILDIYLNVLEEELGSRPKVIYQDLSEYLAWNPGKYQIIYDRLFERKFNNTKISKFVDTKNFVQVGVGLRRCLREFLTNPEFKEINWMREAVKDRYTKERTPLREIGGFKRKVQYMVFRYFIKRLVF